LTVVGISEIAGAIGGAKTALDMLKLATDSKNQAAVRDAILEIQQRLLAAQSAAFADRETQIRLSEEIALLKAELASRDSWDAIVAKYRLTEFSEGRFAYTFSGNDDRSEPPHKACAACFNKRQVSILQTVNKHSGGESVYCQICDKKTILSEFPPAEYRSTGRRSSWIDGY
jgi:hypothetical protein